LQFSERLFFESRTELAASGYEAASRLSSSVSRFLLDPIDRSAGNLERWIKHLCPMRRRVCSGRAREKAPMQVRPWTRGFQWFLLLAYAACDAVSSGPRLKTIDG